MPYLNLNDPDQRERVNEIYVNLLKKELGHKVEIIDKNSRLAEFVADPDKSAKNLTLLSRVNEVTDSEKFSNEEVNSLLERCDLEIMEKIPLVS